MLIQCQTDHVLYYNGNIEICVIKEMKNKAGQNDLSCFEAICFLFLYVLKTDFQLIHTAIIFD